MTDIRKEIKIMLSDMGGEVEFKTRLINKMSPHSFPTILYKVSIADIDEFTTPVLQTIYQRLKLIKFQGHD